MIEVNTMHTWLDIRGALFVGQVPERKKNIERKCSWGISNYELNHSKISCTKMCNKEMARRSKDFFFFLRWVSENNFMQFLWVGLKIPLSCFPKVHRLTQARQYSVAPVTATFMVRSLETVCPGIKLGFSWLSCFQSSAPQQRILRHSIETVPFLNVVQRKIWGPRFRDNPCTSLSYSYLLCKLRFPSSFPYMTTGNGEVSDGDH